MVIPQYFSMFIKRLLFCSLSLFVTNVISQEMIIPFEANKGSISIAKKIFVDSDGYVWYSTYKGLVMTTGNKSVIYQITGPMGEEITKINAVFVDKEDFWLSTEHGLLVFNSKTGTYNWLEINKKISFKNQIIISIKKDVCRGFWLLSNFSNLYRFYNGDLQVFKLPIKGVKILKVLAIDELIIETEFKVIHFNKGQFSLLLNKTKKKYSFFFSKYKSLTPLVKSSLSNYFNNILMADIPELQLSIIGVREDQVIISKSNNKHMYFANYSKGIIRKFRMNNSNGPLELELIDTIKISRQTDGIISDLWGNIWELSSMGLRMICNSSKMYDLVKLGKDTNLSVRGIVQDSNKKLYINTNRGIYMGMNSKYEEIHFKPKTGMDKTFRGVYDFYLENDSILWCYGYHPRLYRVNLKKKIYSSIEMPKKLIRNNKFYCTDLSKINDSTFILSHNSGVLKYNKKSRKFSEMKLPIELRGKSVYKIFFNHSKRILWFGLHERGGLVRINLATNETMHYLSLGKLKESNNINCIFTDSNNITWIGSDLGVFCIDALGNVVKRYGKGTGLSNDIIVNILEQNNAIWLTSYDGLTKIDKDGISIFHMTDKNLVREFNKKSGHIDQNGKFFFGSTTGLISFFSSDLRKNNVSDRLKIQLLSLTKSEYNNSEDYSLTENAALQKTLNLAYDKNYVNMTFGLNDLSYYQKHSYLYRVKENKGSWGEWLSFGVNGNLIFHDMSPGNYSFQVKGENRNKEKSNLIEYDLIIKDVFYNEKPFVIGVLFLLILLVIYIIGYNRRVQKNIYIKKIIELKNKSKLLQVKMNPHFIFNAIAGIEKSVMIQDELTVNRNIGALAKLMRSSLEMCDKELVTIKEELDFWNSYIHFKQTAIDKEIDYRLYLDSNIDLDCKIEGFLIQPIIENAIIHGLMNKKIGVCKLSIHIEEIKGKIQITVEDNGIGRKASRELNSIYRNNHKSFAQQILLERIQISNLVKEESIEMKIIDLMKDEQPIGTKVIFRLPFGFFIGEKMSVNINT